jgi:hypothetical protein
VLLLAFPNSVCAAVDLWPLTINNPVRTVINFRFFIKFDLSILLAETSHCNRVTSAEVLLRLVMNKKPVPMNELCDQKRDFAHQMYKETSEDPSNTARVHYNLMIIMMITESDICETRSQCDMKVGFVNCGCSSLLFVSYLLLAQLRGSGRARRR